MMVATRQRQTREVRGPQPHSVGLIARPIGQHRPDKILMDRCAKEEELFEAEEMKRLAKMQELRNDWEKSSNRRIQANVVRRRVQGMLAEQEFALEARRARLRELLESEKAAYSEQLTSATQETTLERQSRLRERARQLREQREAERLKFVEEKYEQQFREQCEELRSAASRRPRDEVLAEYRDQIQLKQQLKQEQRDEDEFFTQLWFADMKSKADREEQDARRQNEANRATVMFLQQQMAAVDEKKKEEKRLREEEAEILREQAELRQLEAQKEEEEKCRSQRAVKQMLDESLKAKREQQIRQEQEELAFDRKMLEQLLEQSKVEQSQQAQRKREVREEDRRYREYLRQLRADELRREQELDRLCDAEVERMWERRVQQWRVEKLARQRLLEEVMQSRRTQIQNKLADNVVRRQEAAREREQLQAVIADNKRLDAEQAAKQHEQSAAYRTDLLGQIQYNRRQAAGRADEQRRIDERQRETEAEYQRKIDYLREKPVLGKIHPMRRGLYQSQSAAPRLVTPQGAY